MAAADAVSASRPSRRAPGVRSVKQTATSAARPLRAATGTALVQRWAAAAWVLASLQGQRRPNARPARTTPMSAALPRAAGRYTCALPRTVPLCQLSRAVVPIGATMAWSFGPGNLGDLVDERSATAVLVLDGRLPASPPASAASHHAQAASSMRPPRRYVSAFLPQLCSARSGLTPVPTAVRPA